MPLLDIGPRGYHQAQAAASLAFTPLSDRAAIIHRILIDKVSASDTWILSCLGKELARFDIETTGTQQLLGGVSSGAPKLKDIFDFVADELQSPLIYPVPQGSTFNLTNVGGATANLQFEYSEEFPGTVNVGQLNHPLGQHFLTPLVIYRAANVTAAGEVALDTQIGASFLPNLAVDGNMPDNFTFRIVGLWLEGGGRNTFSGSADVQSNTLYLSLFLNGQRMFTRDSPAGIPLVGTASAAGSANTVVGNDLTPYPSFQTSGRDSWQKFDPPIVIAPGRYYQFRLATTGAYTGGATYAAMRQVLLADVMTPGLP